MKNLVTIQLVITILFLNFTNLGAQEKRGTYSVVEIPAPSLKNNLIGTDTVQKIGVYLPPSYSSSKKSYPVVYFLHGHNTKVPESDPGIFDVMKKNTVQELIYVEISGYNLYKGSMYANSPIIGNWEDYVTTDVISYVDNHFRTIPDRNSRGLVGASMGGLGAFNISLKYPTIYSAIHLMSPAISAGDDIINWAFSNDSTIISLKDLSKKLENNLDGTYAERIKKSMNEVGDLWLIVGAGVAYSPNVKQPLLMDLPFSYNDDGTFEKNEPVWQLWRKGFGNLSEKVKKYKDNLKLYIYYGMDVGYYDQLGFNIKSVKQLSSYLWEEKIPNTTYFSDRDHFNGYGINLQNRVIPLMSAYLKGE